MSVEHDFLYTMSYDASAGRRSVSSSSPSFPPSSPLSPEMPFPEIPIIPFTQLPPSVSDALAPHPTVSPAPSTSIPSTRASTSSARLQALRNALESARRLLANERKMRILVLSSDTGGGHRASAEALRSALEKLYPSHVDVNIVDFWVDLAEGFFVKFPQQYTFLAKHPWMWKFTYEITRFPPARFLTESFFSVFAHRNIRHAFDRYNPDLIVSVHPLVNTLSQRVLNDIRKRTEIPPVPYVTVITDLGGAHPTWFHDQSDVIYIPTDGVRKVGLRCGIHPSTMRSFGLPVRPDFWECSLGKKELRRRLGLREEGLAILAIGGGDGVGGLRSIASSLATDLPPQVDGAPVQIVVICGKNARLRTWLSERQWPVPLIPLGFVSNMSDWMAACDILCTKAGPGTIAEGLIRGLPMIITGFLPGQEAANVKYVVDNDVGVFAKKPREIVKVVKNWLSHPDLLADMSTRAQRLGRPHASLDISADIVRVAKDRIKENVASLEMAVGLKSRQSQLPIAPGALSPFLPHRSFISDSSSQSHVVFRVKFLLRVLLGSVLARNALHRRGRSYTPPLSPVEAITDRDEEDVAAYS